MRRWLLIDPTRAYAGEVQGPHTQPATAQQRTWWQVMCLTGLDYFSTLGYQPGIAALAAGLLSPVATLVLVAVTLLGALPVYRRVARESSHGQGSIAMLERILPRWTGKIVVLALLGFAATDFIITITLSAADATAHILQNPYVPRAVHGQQILITLVLVGLLGAVFLKGFREAIGIAVLLVGVYLSLNLVVVIASLAYVARHPHLVGDWATALRAQHPNIFGMAAVALLVFPKLALGLSGFETGVAVMPLVRGRPQDDPDRPRYRIRGTHRLLTTAALIMSCFLVASSFTTALLIPQREFRPGGAANGRALAYIAHRYVGSAFGTGYDISTLLILWFAGASAMAGLLNLVPRYLPRYGMAPSWTRASRPLAVVFTTAAFLVTFAFRASVDAQGGAYATGVLVLITSAAFAVTLAARRARQRRFLVAYGVVTLVLGYTTIANVIERPDGVKIASLFIVAIILTSLLSRALRATELRVTGVQLDPLARRLVNEAMVTGVALDGHLDGQRGPPPDAPPERVCEVHLISNEPNERDAAEYRHKEAEERINHRLPASDPVLFLEVAIGDPSEFEAPLRVIGEIRYGYRILKVTGPTIANTIAAVLLYIRDSTGARPHVYFDWTEGNPLIYLLRYLVFGDGEVAPLTREVLRQAEPVVARRPQVHAG
ncbi:MAG: APC family permease [Micromonosporaceae bacterium]|nr:APC family permease [Micromonosporaceae bacterium]